MIDKGLGKNAGKDYHASNHDAQLIEDLRRKMMSLMNYLRIAEGKVTSLNDQLISMTDALKGANDKVEEYMNEQLQA